MKRIVILWLSVLLIFSSAMVFIDVRDEVAGKAFINELMNASPVHNIDTDEYFNTIQTAINDPDTLNGHTIEVANGTYYENVVINKRLSLVGEDIESTIIDGSGFGDVVYVSADWINISGFTVQNAGNNEGNRDAGIKLYNVENCHIYNNYLFDNPLLAIHLLREILGTCRYNLIENNNCSYNKYGIYIETSSNTIKDNIFFNNSRGILSWGDNNDIMNNTIYYNSFGLLFSASASSNTIVENSIKDNYYGFYISSGNNNEIYHNNFVDNNVSAYDEGSNFWDNGYPSGGNYWSDYSGVDFNSTSAQNVPPPDGIGDTPYTNIGGGAGNQDNYPLMMPIDYDFLSYNISLSDGWNLISLPLIQTNESIDRVLSSIDGKWDCVQVYNATDPDYWKTNSTYKPEQLNDLKSLNHKVGFWIRITETDVNLTVRGYETNSTAILLNTGWNLVGYPTLCETMDVGDAFFGTGANRVEVFNASAPYNIKEVGPQYIMKPGEGYWVRVPVDTTWIVDW